MDYTKSVKKEIILSSLSHFEPEIQQYLSLSDEIQHLMSNAVDENDPCIPIELIAEFMMLQEELYQKAAKKNKEEAN
ncbi:hypothetical protein SAMN05444405_10365 [Bacteroides luti]|jgi:hypothetical protein|uniref:Uncharacterized protein n=1 Tax=Bacteroides luti TaxID=1297750 RepID=A0A1M4WER1_9BACE|nr:hypothetical protein [Bacteroides luti]SHE79650.1 hypothetical protein SAMN05444405_10365 [Bacteroides luti]